MSGIWCVPSAGVRNYQALARKYASLHQTRELNIVYQRFLTAPNLPIPSNSSTLAENADIFIRASSLNEAYFKQVGLMGFGIPEHLSDNSNDSLPLSSQILRDPPISISVSIHHG